MNKLELIKELATRLGTTNEEARSTLDSVLGIITGAVAEGNTVTIYNFGTFERAKRAATTARNPHTGEPVAVPARYMPKFRPGQGFKDRVREENP